MVCFYERGETRRKAKTLMKYYSLQFGITGTCSHFIFREFAKVQELPDTLKRWKKMWHTLKT